MATSAYDEIREAILSGRFPAGHLLGENALAVELGTSRTPVREALHRLEIEQLIERASRGMRVRASSPEEILDIYDVRITLEGAAAKQSALRASELDRMRLRSAQAAMRRTTDDPTARAAVNRTFHEAIWQSSHSATLVDLLHRLNVHLVRYPTTTLASDERWEQALDEHDAILEAIDRHDTETARRLAEEHMTGAREVRLRMYADAEGAAPSG